MTWAITDIQSHFVCAHPHAVKLHVSVMVHPLALHVPQKPLL